VVTNFSKEPQKKEKNDDETDMHAAYKTVTSFFYMHSIRKYNATAPFLFWVGFVASRLLSKPVGLSSG